MTVSITTAIATAITAVVSMRDLLVEYQTKIRHSVPDIIGINSSRNPVAGRGGDWILGSSPRMTLLNALGWY
jgi:hypothetical protein